MSAEPAERNGTLFAAAKLRVPRFGPDDSQSFRVEQLESYLLESAWWQGELSETRLQTHDALRLVQDEWDHLVGWEALRRSKTEVAVEDAKRQLRPDLYDALRKARWLVARLSEEIDRLERDATKVSRAYTLMTGS